MRERIRLEPRRLRAELARSRLSQNAWARRLGLSRSYLSMLVNGQRRYPSAGVRRRLLEVLDLELEDLFVVERTAGSSPASVEHRGSRRGGLMNTLQDLRHSLRTLARRPAFAAVAVLVLALGIGANAALFSVVDGVLLRPLPLPAPDRLIFLHENNLAAGYPQAAVAPANWADWNARAESFERIGAFFSRDANLASDGRAARVAYQQVTDNFFEVLGVPALLGRTFEPGENQPGRDDVVVLSYGFWQEHFGGRDDVVGQALRLDGELLTVLGVLPRDFVFLRPTVRLWKPLELDPETAAARSSHFLWAVGRLRGGATLAGAEAELHALARGLADAHPDTNAGWSVTLRPLHDVLVSRTRPAILLLWATTALVLLLACANLAHLLLARAAGRRQELAVRVALGAGSRRLIGQLLTESVVLAAAGGALGLLLAWWGVQALPRLASGALPRLDTITIDGRVVAFTAALSWTTGILFGILPAIRASRGALASSLRQSGRHATGRRLSSALVAGEVAIAAAVLIAAGLLLRSLVEVLEVDPGFRAHNVLSLRIEPPMRAGIDPGADTVEQTRQRLAARRPAAAFYGRLLERIEALPGVEAAAAVNEPPLGGYTWAFELRVEGRPAPPRHETPKGVYRVPTPGYFELLGVPLLRGRALAPEDRHSSRRVVVIDEELARLYWGDEDPIGQRISTAVGMPPELAATGWYTYTVVGVVGHVWQSSVEGDKHAAAYFPFEQSTQGFFDDWGMTLLIKTVGDPLGIADAVRGEVTALDPTLPAFGVRTMDEVLASSVAPRLFQVRLLAGFAALALVLVAVGIYGVIAFSVSRRTREIGLRIALGARGADVVRQVLAEGMLPVGLGLAIGCAAALGLGRVFAGLLFGVAPADPRSFAVSAAVLLAVALAACLVPARRAARVDPLRALHDD